MLDKIISPLKNSNSNWVPACLGLGLFFLPISKALSNIGLISALILWLIGKFLRREDFLIPRPILTAYCIFWIFCFCSIFHTDFADWKLGVRGIFKWLQYFGIFCVCAEFFQNKKAMERLILIFLASMVLITFNGFYQLHTGTDFLRHVHLDPGRILRMKSSLGAPNTLAAFYLFAIPLTLIFFGKSMRQNLLSASLLALFVVGLILTYSRAAFVGIIFSAVIALIIKKKWRVVLMALGLLGILFLICQPLYENLLGSLTLKDITVGERLKYWSYTWAMIEHHPIFGIGLNMYHQRFVHFVPVTETYRGYAHNSYLQIWAEIGTIGFVSFLFLFVWGIYSAIKTVFKSTDSTLLCLLAGCLAFLFQALFDNNFFSVQTAYLLWIFWGMLIGRLIRDGRI